MLLLHSSGTAATHDRRQTLLLTRKAEPRNGLEIEERFYQLFTLRDGKVFRFEEYSESGRDEGAPEIEHG